MSTFGIIHRFAGGTKEQYDEGLKHAHPADGNLPAGQTFHAAGATDDGFVVVALWDSRESWERFRDDTLLSGFQAAGDAGLPVPPQETTFEIHNEQTGG